MAFGLSSRTMPTPRNSVMTVGAAVVACHGAVLASANAARASPTTSGALSSVLGSSRLATTRFGRLGRKSVAGNAARLSHPINSIFSVASRTGWIHNAARAVAPPFQLPEIVTGWRFTEPRRLHGNTVFRSNHSRQRNMSRRSENVGDRFCCYCGIHESDSDEAHWIEHVVPMSTGGAHRIENVAVACKGCNTEKSATLPVDHLFSIADEVTAYIADDGGIVIELLHKDMPDVPHRTVVIDF